MPRKTRPDRSQQPKREPPKVTIAKLRHVRNRLRRLARTPGSGVTRIR